MEDPIFQIAYQTSRHSMMDDLWHRMDPKERTASIYREMRRIDAGNSTPSPDTKPGLSHARGACQHVA